MGDVRLGVDCGSKYVGVAVSDRLGKTARNLLTFERGRQRNDASILAQLVAEHGASEVVVGMPYSMDGTVGPQARQVQTYVSGLKDQLDVPVTTWDERLTSVSAENLLGRRRKHLTHEVAAAIILQSYLDSLEKT
ncbi:MAG: Holliday junction resolvase RuvX [Terriglobia bacterium]